MLTPITTKAKVLLTSIATFLVLSMLLWDHFHGGVPSHHILHQKELPAISNWWSGLFIPLLTWILLGRINSRISKQNRQEPAAKSQNIKSRLMFSIGLSFGILISIAFENNYHLMLDNVLYAIIIMSLLIPIFLSEFILGFVLGMTFTFGAILPTLFILIAAAFGYLIYRFIRSLILQFLSFLSRQFVKRSEN